MKNIDKKSNLSSKLIDKIYKKNNELIDIINSLNIQKNNIIVDLQRCYELNDRKVYLNNLELTISMLLFYNHKKNILNSFLSEYCIINSNNNSTVKLAFIEIWKNKVEKYLNKDEKFKFQSISYDLLIDNINIDIINDEISNKKCKFLNSKKR